MTANARPAKLSGIGPSLFVAAADSDSGLVLTCSKDMDVLACQQADGSE